MQSCQSGMTSLTTFASFFATNFFVDEFNQVFHVPLEHFLKLSLLYLIFFDEIFVIKSTN